MIPKLDARAALTRGALFLAMALVFQSLRLLIPLPPIIGMFLIGSLVNATLALAARYAGLSPAALMAALLPAVGFLQGQLAIFPLVPVAAAGNLVVVFFAARLWNSPLLWCAPPMKALVLYGGCLLLVRLLELAPGVASVALTVMSWPQLITAALGLFAARQICARVAKAARKGA